MTAGIPNFVGERLKEAREARGLTGSSLADRVGIVRASISLYEIGKSSPQLETLINLATELNFPQSFFLRPKARVVADTLFYRSAAGATNVDRLKAKRRYDWQKEITSYLRGFVRFPPVVMPEISIPQRISEIDSEFIEFAAAQTRTTWGLGSGPISDVTLLLENNGTIVSKVALGTMQMDGFSGWSNETNTPHIILGADKGSAARSRFDVAHELGHIILHKRLTREDLRDPILGKLVESQAHNFAGSFLLPESTFSNDLYIVALDSLKALKSKWAVSIGAMLHRAQDLNLIAEQSAKRLWANYNRRGWKYKEPLDDEVQPERPRLLRRAFELIVRQGVHPPGQIVSEIGLSASDILELASIGYSLLNSNHEPTIQDVNEPPNAQDLGLTTAYVIQGELPLN